MFVSGSTRNGLLGPSTGDTTWRVKTPEIVTSLSEIKIKNMIQEFRTIDMRYRTDYRQEIEHYLNRIREIVNEIESDVLPTLVLQPVRRRRAR